MKKVVNATFYYFTASLIAPKSLSTKLQWQEVYNNFKALCSNQQNISNNILNDISNLPKNSINKAQDPLEKN